ncbi:serine O-acetyltransferase EpsC [Salinisphaera sp. Q1T1-3]|uniref:serine O-acetyltransferase EpsC n=1 Tax=Salinisphaera sp. Q1T1-3 TaxID=2321229 RepID=UPI0013143C4F|nr:serine O-acetyltransferase EpsC [Salinisphaera sp. Q1T1-3]
MSESMPRRWDVATVVADLREARRKWRAHVDRETDLGDREFPSVERIEGLIKQLRGALFPLRLGPADLQREAEDHYVGYAIDLALSGLVEEARLELDCRERSGGDAHRREAVDRVRRFAERLADIRLALDEDIDAAYAGDPAARFVDEILLCYPGIHALLHYRVAHVLHELGLPLIARIITELAHSSTGIDIHPGAVIGRAFFIDHGTGVVIGETARIGDRVRLYQAVTLGAKSFETTTGGQLVKGKARHPVVEDDVVIYAGATVLGRVTIGTGSTIGGNVWLTHDVAPGSVITQARCAQHD